MRERDEDAPGDASGALAGGLGAEVEGDVGGDAFGDGAVVDTPLPSDADRSVDGTFDPGAGDAADGGSDDTLTPDGGPGGNPEGDGPLLDLGDEAQGNTIMDGIEFLVDELHEALLGTDDDPGAGPDGGAVGL